jgi:RNA 2',3'-cyclic 3'-phosphodiesterase
MRSFVALPLPDEVRNDILAAMVKMEEIRPDLKWVGPDALHVTLAFLGEIDEGLAAAIGSALMECCLMLKPASAGLAGLLQFPERGALRVLAIGVRDELSALSDAYETANRAIEAAARARRETPPNADWISRRPFTPHVTLARSRREGVRPARAAEFELSGRALEAPFLFRRCVLYRSELRREGPSYVPLVSCELKE